MNANGVIGLARSIWSDPDFKDEPFTEREAFMWLVCEAAWKSRRARGARGLVELQRGEFCHSIRFMADAWSWKKTRTENYLKRMKNRDTIRDTIRDGSKVYFIKNYNKFQIVGMPKQDANQDIIRDQNGTPTGHQRDKLEEGKKVRRKEKRERKSARAKNKLSLCPEDWMPKSATVDALIAEGKTNTQMQACRLAMIDWSRGGGKMKHDWDATFRNWVRRDHPAKQAGKPDPRNWRATERQRAIEESRKESLCRMMEETESHPQPGPPLLSLEDKTEKD